MLVTVGRIDARERYKGHDLVIQALPQLVIAGHDVLYVVLGDGDDVTRLQSLAHTLGVSDRVRFLGECDLETLVDAYRLADLFVMPSAGEGFGISFIEAMACGTPALGLRVAGAADAFADGEIGTLVSKARLFCAIKGLLETSGNRSALSLAVRARFGREMFSKTTRDAINRVRAS